MTVLLKRFAPAIVGFTICAANSLFAQNITGSWQGTLQPPPQQAQAPALRIVMKVSRADDESLKAVLYNIDQPGPPINANQAAFQGSVLKLTIAALGATYEGKLTADGNSITGTLAQGGPGRPLNLTRETPQTAWAIPEPPPPPVPMSTDGKPSFEVATIKPSNPDQPGQSILIGRGGRNMFTTTNTTLNDLVVFAYGIHLRQVTGAPGWMETEKYDLTAKPDREGIPNGDQLKAMVKELLAERFQLVFHREKKELSAYTITVLKTGPKLAKNDTKGNLPGFGGRGPGNIGVRNSTMEEFAGFLQARILDRPVVDQTGLTDRYDFTLVWRPDQLAAPRPDAPPLPEDIESRPDLYKAIQEQLGLKLEATKAPVEVLVIDKVQKPSDN